MVNVYAPQIFFIVFRECLEAGIIITVLLSFLKQSLGGPDQDPLVYKKLRRQVWWGAGSGVILCLIIGGTFIGVFYSVGHNIWGQTEDLWEGIFYLIATIIITAMGLALLRINKTQEKWRVKLAKALMEHKTRKESSDSHPKGRWFDRFRGQNYSRRYVMFILPLITTMREGVEAIVFVGGVSLGYPATAFPLPVITGAIAAGIIGYLLYKGGNQMSIRIFLIASSCVLYLIAAGMFSKSVWSLQYHVFAAKVGSDVAEAGNGNGSYDILETVWHVNCCNPETDNGWDVFNALLGWQNTATYGSVISYNMYWLFIIFAVSCMMYEEKTGALPLKRPLVKFMLKVPLLKLYVAKKQKVSQKDADFMVSQGHAYLANDIGRARPEEDPEAITKVPATEKVPVTETSSASGSH